LICSDWLLYSWSCCCFRDAARRLSRRETSQPRPTPRSAPIPRFRSGATIYLYDRQDVTTEIRADLIRRFESIDSTMGYVLDIDFFDSLGQVSSNLVGDSGVIREKSNRLQVYGRVVVVTQDSARLETDYLIWDPEIGKIQSDAYVKFTRHGDVMTGWGMEADPDLGRLKILSDVSGSVSESEVLSEE